MAISAILSQVQNCDSVEIICLHTFCQKLSTRFQTKVPSVAHSIIGNRKDSVCLQLHGQVSRQPKPCHSAMLDPKGRAFCRASGSL